MSAPIKKLPSWALNVAKIPAAERAQGERDERNVELVDRAYDKAAKDGPKVDVSGAGQLGVTTFERLLEDAPVGEDYVIVPIDVKVGPQYPLGFHYILSDRDYELVRSGRYCERFLCRLPDIWTAECPTCGWPRDLFNRDSF